MIAKQPVLILGSGVAALTAALTAVACGMPVTLVCRGSLDWQPLLSEREELLACAINFCRDGDSVQRHADEIYEASQELVSKNMMLKLCGSAEEFLNILVRTGVVFDRDVEGYLQFFPTQTGYRRLLKGKFPLEQQVRSAFGRQILHHVAEGRMQLLEHHDFLSVVLDESLQCRGGVLQDLRTMQILTIPTNSVILADHDVTSLWNGAQRLEGCHSLAHVYRMGASLSGLEFFQTQPDGTEQNINWIVRHAFGGCLVDDDMRTTLDGVWAIGGSGCLAGAGLLSGQALLMSWYGGRRAIESILDPHRESLPVLNHQDDFFVQAMKQEQSKQMDVLDMSGPENLYQLQADLIQLMRSEVGLQRYNGILQATQTQIEELKERFQRVSVRDKSLCYNQELLLARAMQSALDLAHAVTMSALCRNESRGEHHKPDMPFRDDAQYRRSTIVNFIDGRPQVSFVDVDSDNGARVVTLQRTAI